MSEFLAAWLPVFSLQAAARPAPPAAAPAAAIELDGPLRRIAAANHTARAAGVAAGLSLSQALGREPRLTAFPRDEAAEGELQARLLAAAGELSPRVEAVGDDAAVLDLTGLRRLFGPAEAIAARLLAMLAAAGLHAHAGLAAQPALALLGARSVGLAAQPATGAAACLHVPDCPVPPLARLPAGGEAEFLAPLPVAFLAEIGALTPVPPEPLAELLELLGRWGVATLGDLAALPPRALRQRLGEAGLALRRLARGEAGGVLAPPPLPRDRRRRTLAFEPPLADGERLRQALAAELEALVRELEREDRMVEAAELRLEREGAAAQVRSRRFLTPTRSPRDLLAQLAPLAVAPAPLPPGARAGVVALALECRVASPRRLQPRLFAAAAPDPARWPKVLARVSELAGPAARAGSPQPLDSHRPGAFRLAAFQPPPAGAAAPAPAPAGLALRRYRPPRPVQVQRANDDELTLVGAKLQLPPRRGESGARQWRVTRAAGPWRADGQWWGTEPWDCEDWEIEVAPWRRAGEAGATSIRRLRHDRRSGVWQLIGYYD